MSEPSLGLCDSCGRRFPYRLIHNGFNDTAYAYCNRCGMTAFLGLYTARPAEAPYKPFERISRDFEPYLQPCECGGHFTAEAGPRCPKCQHTLSAAAATKWIEANAPGSAKGWRWQRNWSGLYCIIVNGHSVDDPWL